MNLYIGVDIDSYSEASSIDISRTNTSNYKKDKKGVDNLFSSVCKASNLYYEDEVIDSSWKQDLEDYIQDNEEDNSHLF